MPFVRVNAASIPSSGKCSEVLTISDIDSLGPFRKKCTIVFHVEMVGRMGSRTKSSSASITLRQGNLLMNAFSKDVILAENFKEGCSYELCGYMNVVPVPVLGKPSLTNFSNSSLTLSKFQIWIQVIHSLTELPCNNNYPDTREKPTRPQIFETPGSRMLENVKVVRIDLYRYLGCQLCTTTMKTLNSICRKCGAGTERKTCLIARRVDLLHELTGEEFNVVAYNKELEELFNCKASDFESDEDVRQRLVGAMISLRVERKQLTPEKSRFNGGKDFADVAKNISIISVPSSKTSKLPPNISEEELTILMDSPEDISYRKIAKGVRRNRITIGPSNVNPEVCHNKIQEEYYIDGHAGLFLCINIYHYPKRLEHPTRFGSKQDVETALQISSTFGFNTFTPSKISQSLVTEEGVVQGHISPEDITAVLEEFKIALQKQNASSSLIFIMGHGRQGEITCSNEKSICLWRKIVYEFSEENFPAFSGKPKMFFIEGCQSFGKDVGKTTNSGNQLAILADTLVVISSIPGQNSFLCPIEGSIFVQTVRRVLDYVVKERKSWNILEIIKTAQFAMNKIPIRVVKTRQILEYRDILLRKLYFPNMINSS